MFKGFIEALTFWRQLTHALDCLRRDRGMRSILIGHVRVKTVNDPLTNPYDAFVFDINDRAANLIYRWADCILFASRKTYTRKAAEAHGRAIVHASGTDEPVLYTRARPNHPGGGRGVYGRLPYELPLSWSAFADAVESEMEVTSE